jgi:methyl-accepting chemotaxis protein
MSFITKINLAMLMVFIIGLSIAGYIANIILQENAKREVVTQASIMMEGALAIRNYTITEIKPLLIEQLEQTFLPQTVPSYAATQNFNRLRKTHPEFIYKEAALNPTNPRNRAMDWESDIIQQFRNNMELKEIIGERNTPTGPSLFLARPMQINDADCLICHSTLDEAPEPLKTLYGTTNGYGWKLNEIVGSQIVSVPLSVPLNSANYVFNVFIFSLASIFILIFIILNILLRIFVIRPVHQITVIADEISKSGPSKDEFQIKGNDDIAKLSQSFNRMRRSLEKAMEMLK